MRKFYFLDEYLDGLMKCLEMKIPILDFVGYGFFSSLNFLVMYALCSTDDEILRDDDLARGGIRKRCFDCCLSQG